MCVCVCVCVCTVSAGAGHIEKEKTNRESEVEATGTWQLTSRVILLKYPSLPHAWTHLQEPDDTHTHTHTHTCIHTCRTEPCLSMDVSFNRCMKKDKNMRVGMKRVMYKSEHSQYCCLFTQIHVHTHTHTHTHTQTHRVKHLQ